jgi:KaiC/GvpD/RAD55 family RecA-like ATPase
MQSDSTGFSHEVVYAADLIEDAKKLMKNVGRTDRYSTGLLGLDHYLHGGYGIKDMWEIILLHGSYGSGKSTFAINLLADPIKTGVRVGIMALEDDPRVVVKRLAIALNDIELSQEPLASRRIRLLPPEPKDKGWSLSDLAKEIELWFTDPVYGVEIIVLDHLQFAFDFAEYDGKRGEWGRQAKFMQQVNGIMRRTNKTLILVSQQNADGNLAGSRAIRYAGSTMLKFERVVGDPNQRAVFLEKTRETAPRDYACVLEFRNQKFYDVPLGEQPSGARHEI